MDSLSGERASLTDVMLVMRNVSVIPPIILIMFEFTNVTSGVRVCNAALDVDTLVASETHSMGVIGQMADGHMA
jgi:hypothetical protein